MLAVAAPDVATAIPAPGPGQAHVFTGPCAAGLHPQGCSNDRRKRGGDQQRGEALVVHAMYYGEAISGREIPPRQLRAHKTAGHHTRGGDERS